MPTASSGRPAEPDAGVTPEPTRPVRGAWEGLRTLLITDPRDAGCEETWQLIDVYAELVLAGHDPEQTLPGITVHLNSCDPCAEDYRGLLHAMRAAAEDR